MSHRKSSGGCFDGHVPLGTAGGRLVGQSCLPQEPRAEPRDSKVTAEVYCRCPLTLSGILNAVDSLRRSGSVSMKHILKDARFNAAITHSYPDVSEAGQESLFLQVPGHLPTLNRILCPVTAYPQSLCYSCQMTQKERKWAHESSALP